MSTQVIKTPGGINFSGFYYPELKRDLLSFLRANKTRIGLTDENEYEVHVQLISAFALMGHLNNVRLDSVATEMFLDSAQMLESVKKLLRLTGIELKSATPAIAEIVAKLSEVSTLDQAGFIPALAEFTTDSIPPIVYETSVEGENLSRTDRLSHVFGLEPVSTGIAGSVDTNAPDILIDTDVVFPADVVDDLIFIPAVDGKFTQGIFKVTERIGDSEIRLVLEPTGKNPAFQTESDLSWKRLRYTSDQASEANDDTPTELVTPWTGAPVADSFLLFSHQQVQPTQVDLEFGTFGDAYGVWEYYDGERSNLNPLSVSGAVTLIFDCKPLLGNTDRSNAQVRVTYLKTGASKVLTSTWNGTQNLVSTTNLFGQITASNDISDYHITSDWVPFVNTLDTTIVGGVDWVQDGNVKWSLPQTRDRKWGKASFNSQTTEDIWTRYRVITGAAATPVLKRIRIDQGEQYISFFVTQGETVGPQILGSSSGLASQTFKLPETPYLDDTELIEVDEGGAGTWVTYSYVTSFLNSDSTNKHYVREVNAADEATIIFGDGVNGKIPPVGLSNVRSTYRVGGEDDGNVGEDILTVNADGVAGLSSLTNPRPAEGWRLKDGGDVADLERVKRDSPAEQRVRDVASKPQDAERLAAQNFVDSVGIKPVARAFGVEEGFGIKTIKLLVVGAGGTSLTSTQLDDLELYFNGDRNSRPPILGVSMMNYRVIPVNFEPTVIDIIVKVVWSGGSADAIKNALAAFLTPIALEDDGVTFVWNFGSQVSFSKVHTLIHSVDPNIQDIPVLQLKKGTGSFVSQSLDLGQNELPILGNVTVTIAES